MSLMRLASKYRWNAVFSFHAAVLERIEAGLPDWDADFSEIERFNISKSQRLTSAQPSTNNTRLRCTWPRNYCREWNRTGSCDNPTHQPGAEHIYTYCKLTDHAIATFPTRPPSSSIRSPSSAPPLTHLLKPTSCLSHLHCRTALLLRFAVLLEHRYLKLWTFFCWHRLLTRILIQ